MPHKYNYAIAKHYAAFRPPLHGSILHRIIKPHEKFKSGLDIGCGTGYSTIALAEYCHTVFGIDPNSSMLEQATTHNKKIIYFSGSGDDLSILGNNRIDIVSFAGSLSYAKTDVLKKELLKIISSNAIVLVYDFQVLIDELVEDIIGYSKLQNSNYSFTVNLDDWSEFETELCGTEYLDLSLTEQQAVHLLLANSDRYGLFQNKFSDSDPFDLLTGYLQKCYSDLKLEANIYFSRHLLSMT